MIRKGFFVILTTLLVLGLFPQNEASANTFSDVPASHAYYQEITYLLDNTTK